MTAKEFLEINIRLDGASIELVMTEFAKYHVQEALLAANENKHLLIESNYGRYESRDPKEEPNLKTQKTPIYRNNFGHGDCNYEIISIDSESILDSYPLENIK